MNTRYLPLINGQISLTAWTFIKFHYFVQLTMVLNQWANKQIRFTYRGRVGRKHMMKQVAENVAGSMGMVAERNQLLKVT